MSAFEEEVLELEDRARSAMPATVTFSATAMPPLMPASAVRSVSTSNDCSPAIGTSIRMKPTAVPSSASRSSDSATNQPIFSRAAQLIGQRAQQQRLVQPAALLGARFRHEVADVAGQHARRQLVPAVQHHAVAGDLEAAGMLRQPVADPPRRHQLARYEQRLVEAVQRGQREDAEDQDGEAGPVGLQHELDQAEIGEHQGAEEDKPGQDHPAQQRQVIAQFLRSGERPGDRSTAHSALILPKRVKRSRSVTRE